MRAGIEPRKAQREAAKIERKQAAARKAATKKAAKAKGKVSAS
jgi:hypothetical protein